MTTLLNKSNLYLSFFILDIVHCQEKTNIGFGLRLGLGLGFRLGFGILGLLDLEGRKCNFLALAAGQRLPEEDVLGNVPGEEANPGLHVVVKLEGDVFGLRNLARGVGDLVLWLLVLELELATAGWETRLV